MKTPAFLPYELDRSRKPIDLPLVVARRAARFAGEWVNDTADARSWTPEGKAATERAARTVYDDLAAGRLTAYVYLSSADCFKIVPPLFWRDDLKWMDRLTEKIEDPFSDHWDLPILVLEDEENRLSCVPAQGSRRGPKCRYDWASFEAEAVRRLDHEGDYTEGWIQAELERQMAEWCDANWEKTPSEGMIRKHVARARDAFIAARSGL